MRGGRLTRAKFCSECGRQSEDGNNNRICLLCAHKPGDERMASRIDSLARSTRMSARDSQAARTAQWILQNTTDEFAGRVPRNSERSLCDLLTESHLTKQTKSLRVRESSRSNVGRTRSRSWSPPKMRDPLFTHEKRWEYRGETEWSDASTVRRSVGGELATSFHTSPEHNPAQERCDRTSPLTIIQQAKKCLFNSVPTGSERHADGQQQVSDVETTSISIDEAMDILMRNEQKIKTRAQEMYSSTRRRESQTFWFWKYLLGGR
jgi:hypothetical protein